MYPVAPTSTCRVRKQLLIVGAILLLFGARGLREFARSMGKAEGELQRGLDCDERDQAAAILRASAHPEAAVQALHSSVPTA